MINKKDIDETQMFSQSGKRILLLQGPIGPFFAELQEHLLDNGYEVHHIIFNFADYFYSSRSKVTIFQKAEHEWLEWIRSVLGENAIDLVILMGCERERHAIARQIAEELSIPVLSLEEGYVRPGYITAERGGNNRFSPIRELPNEVIRSKNRTDDPIATEGHSFGKMAWFGFNYYVLRSLGRPLIAGGTHHKNRQIVKELGYWIRYAFRKIKNKPYNNRTIEKILQEYPKRFYIVPLQVYDDMQLVKASRGWTNATLIEKSIVSFAKTAPHDTALVIKVHPLERGHTNARQVVAKLSREYGCQDRVFFLDDGSIGHLTVQSAGMLTINSTSAFSAMLRKVPLGVLGDAMFRRDDLAFCIDSDEDLDQFWNNHDPERLNTAFLFRKHLRATAIVPGDFYLKENRAIAIVNLCNLIKTQFFKKT